MNEENKLIIKQLNKFGRVLETSELLKMIEVLENNWNELKKTIKKRIKDYEKHLKQGDEPTSKYEGSIERDREILKQMKEMEQWKDE